MERLLLWREEVYPEILFHANPADIDSLILLPRIMRGGIRGIEVYRSMGRFRALYFEDVKKSFLKRFSPNFPADAAVLDLASGDGLWLRLWHTNMNLFGTEASDNFKEILSARKVTILRDEEIEPEHYNLVSLFDFLEHVEKPDEFLVHKWSLVKPGCYLILGVPDMGKMIARMLGSIYYLVCPMHLSYFDRFSLGKLLRKTCSRGNISIFPSPSLRTDLNGMV